MYHFMKIYKDVIVSSGQIVRKSSLKKEKKKKEPHLIYYYLEKSIGLCDKH